MKPFDLFSQKVSQPQIVLTLPEFTLAFPSLFKPFVIKDMMSPRFAAIAVYPKGCVTLTDVIISLDEIAEKQFGVGGCEHYPINHDPKHFTDKTILRVSSKTRSLVQYMRDGQKYMATEEDIYPGCRCIAEVQPFAYDIDTPEMKKRGVALHLMSITKVGDIKITDDEAEMLMNIDNFMERSL